MSNNAPFPYYYDQQIKKYILQFMAIFAELQVEIQKPNSQERNLIPVTVHYGSKDRVVASILADNTQNKAIRVPAMSAYVNSLEVAPELRKGRGSVRKTTYLPQGGIFPQDLTVVEQIMPVPYTATVSLSIMTSNQDQHFQILEQIMMIFDPDLEIETSDGFFDWGRITTVQLVNIGLEENYPPGPDRRLITTTLEFKFPIWISLPADLKKGVIERIKMRISAVSSAAVTNAQIIEEIDSQGQQYHIYTIDLNEI